MGANEKFCLRWNDFESNISLAFQNIRDEKDFFDITLSCGQKQIQAHKLILSACSPFFRSVLKQNPHQHPLIYLKGVEFSDLQSVLNFMYHGEVNVAQEELNSFLAVAEDLRVKGLTQTNSSTKDQAHHASNLTAKNQDPPPQRPRPAPKQTTRQPSPAAVDDDIQEVVPIKSEPREPQPHQPEEYSRTHHPVAVDTTEEQSVTAYHEDAVTGYEEYEDYQYPEQDTSIPGQHQGETFIFISIRRSHHHHPEETVKGYVCRSSEPR